ncbi:hypothetical protein ISU10_16755 [Nocardioides agariphilus]|jgi:hypothetical protein|uniref:Uncharacterized protein n=1 Tax=Nocardioides agariphilus TaxID=433664 RepID=A0A930YI71_9ACTN|nr:hypothetical protein [Nocardioides agariphilus]MBF4769421.1 hypothetical protein [Nocardioides agariphilus]
MQSTWLLAQPTPGQVRAGDPLADADFHHAMAARAPGLAILLGERLARSRGAGGRTVAGAWADSGADVTVIADADPRHRSGTRLLVDGAVAVEQWARDIRALGATGACWHADLDSPTDQAPLTATVAGAITRAGLAPMLWVTGPGSSVHDTDGIRAIGDLLDRAAADGADLGRLRVCLRVDPSAREWGGRLGSLVTGLSAAIPHAVAQVVVVVPRDRLHLAQSDAYELEHAMAHESAAWPLTHCAGDLALRQVGGWWREPGLARRAGNRFETIVGQLARPTGPVYVHRHESPAAPGETGDQPRTGSPRTFDTSLFRGRSLYRHRSTR